ncbi:MAG TPA: globin domain-containing protein [Longimicrobiales bacterium]|nr:globin domain-containing protein [Longimicrobiales bacterium]
MQLQSAHSLALGSYDRCLRSPRFFARFYERLLASDPSIPPLFARTEFPRQYKLLQHGLGLLLSYSSRPDGELLERIAARHSARGIGVHPSLYPCFVESLIATIREHDPHANAEVERAWRESLAPGIAFMAARYAP